MSFSFCIVKTASSRNIVNLAQYSVIMLVYYSLEGDVLDSFHALDIQLACACLRLRPNPKCRRQYLGDATYRRLILFMKESQTNASSC